MDDIAAKVRVSQARMTAYLRARHQAEGCPTWERYTYPHPNVVDGRPIEGWGCPEHGLFTTAGARS